MCDICGPTEFYPEEPEPVLSDISFRGYPKTPRLFRDMVITEKIDGTNAAVIIERLFDGVTQSPFSTLVYLNDNCYEVVAQSRSRLIKPGKDTDNMGFAAWVWDNAQALVETLGMGTHYGEWWGSGIQRGYGMRKGAKRFSLFNTARWSHINHLFATTKITELRKVPVLYEGPFDTAKIIEIRESLRSGGSYVNPAFMNPEGIIVFHSASGQVYKSLLDNDEIPKGLVNK